MDLLAFLNSKTTGEQAEFATACGSTVGYLRQVAYGNRQCSATLAINIDRESGGLVPFDALCPNADWEYVHRKASSPSYLKVAGKESCPAGIQRGAMDA